MATTAKIAKEHKKPKYKVRLRNRCQLCGRPRCRKMAPWQLSGRPRGINNDLSRG